MILITCTLVVITCDIDLILMQVVTTDLEHEAVEKEGVDSESFSVKKLSNSNVMSF